MNLKLFMVLTEVEFIYGKFQIIQMKENGFQSLDLLFCFCIAKNQNYDRYETTRV